MEEIKIKYELDKDVDQKLREMHSMLSKIVETRQSPLSEIWIPSKKLRQELGISARTEQNWIKAGILVKHKIQGKLFYKLEEITKAILKNSENNDQ
jgi:frataxin-like iron-binding protein CyaY